MQRPIDAENERSFRKLLPGFVIPAGNQVVLKIAKPLADGQQFKPPGSVGIVLECPADNQRLYLVRFTDGETVTAGFHELALRRREVEDALGEVTEDLRPWIIYVLSQFRRMANAVKDGGEYKAKHAMHLIRLLHSGIAALETGEIRIDVGEHREELLRIRNDGLPFDAVKQRALELDDRFQEAFERTSLPEQPDYRRVEDFLIRARRRMVDA